MKNKIFVPVHPNTLKWARIELGLSLEQVADKTSFSIEKLENWEHGKQGIVLTQAKKLAKKYKVSLPFLYLKQTPTKHHFKSIIDFRSENYKNNYSDRLCLAIKTAHARQVWMRQFLQTENHQPLDWLGSFSNEKNTAYIAQKCRQWLGVEQNEIIALKDNKQTLDYWITKIEEKRVIVAQNNNHRFSQVDRKEYSGLVLYDNYAPFILLNPKDNPSRKIFTLLHELAHLLVNQNSSLSLIDFRTDDSEYDETEVFCNNIASNILIDTEVIKHDINVSLSIEESIEKFTKQFKVSYSAVAVAMKKTNIISQNKLEELLDFYKSKYKQFLAQEKLAINNKSQIFQSKPDKQTLDRCGKLLTTQVLTAYEKGSINASEVYDVLGMKLKYLNNLSSRLNFPLHRWMP